MRGYTAFGKLGRSMAEDLDVLVGVESAPQDEQGRPSIVGQITKPDGSCYELRVTLVKEGTATETTAKASLSRAQKDAVDKARAKRSRKPAA